MRVWELIEQLKECPPDAHVSMMNIYDPDCDFEAAAHITGVISSLTDIDEIVLGWEYDE